MDSDEDEVFFGPVSEKEKYLSSKYHNRRTLVLPHSGPLKKRWSSMNAAKPSKTAGPDCSEDKSSPNSLNMTFDPLFMTSALEPHSESDLFTSTMPQSPVLPQAKSITDVTANSIHGETYSSSVVGSKNVISTDGMAFKEVKNSGLYRNMECAAISDTDEHSDGLKHHLETHMKELDVTHSISQLLEEFEIQSCLHLSDRTTETTDYFGSRETSKTKSLEIESSMCINASEIEKHKSPDIVEDQRESDFAGSPTVYKEIQNCVSPDSDGERRNVSSVDPENVAGIDVIEYKKEDSEVDNCAQPDTVQEAECTASEEFKDEYSANVLLPEIIITSCKSSVELPQCANEDENHRACSSVGESVSISQNTFCLHESSEVIDSESYGSGNRGMIVSDVDSQISSSSSSRYSLSCVPAGSQYSGEDKEKSHSQLQNNTSANNDSSTSHDDSKDYSGISSSPKFNDTLEEMEMLLKYGMHYVESSEDAKSKSSKDELSDKSCEQDSDIQGDEYKHVTVEKSSRSETESMADDPIVSPRKSSVASITSTFLPKFESSRALSSNVKEGTVQVEMKPDLSNSPAMSQSDEKKNPPPKPPRNLTGAGITVNVPAVIESARTIPPNIPTQDKSARTENIASKSIAKASLCSVVGMGVTDEKKGSKLCTPRKSPVCGNSELSCSQSVVGGSGPGYYRTLASRSRLPPSPSTTPTSSHVIKKSSTAGPGLNSLKTDTGTKPSRTGLPPRPVSTKKLCPGTKHTPAITVNAQRCKSPLNRPLAPGPHRVQRQPFKPGMNVVSPIARYLKSNPPPPLIRTVRPRFGVSPVKHQPDHLPAKSPENSSEHPGLEENSMKKEGDILNAQTDLDELASELNSVKVQVVKAEDRGRPKGQVLPYMVSSSALPVIVGEDKENKRLRHRGEYLGKQEPVVLKHTGRAVVSKGSICAAQGLASSSPKMMPPKSPLQKILPSPVSRSNERESLVEISICEPCKNE